MTNEEWQRNQILKRLAGLPNNVTTWKWDDDGHAYVGDLVFTNNKPMAGLTTTDKSTTKSTTKSTSPIEYEPDWDYTNALIWKVFGKDDSVMNNYNQNKRQEQISKDNRAYNEYLNEASKREQQMKEMELIAEKDKEKAARVADEQKAFNQAKGTAISEYIKAKNDVSTTMTDLNNKLEQLKIMNYIDEDTFAKWKSEIDTQTTRRQAYDKYDKLIATGFANDKLKKNTLKDVEEDNNLTVEDKAVLKNRLNATMSKTAESRAAAVAGKVGEKTGKAIDAKDEQSRINSLINIKPSQLSDEDSKFMEDRGYVWSKKQGKWDKRG